MHLKQNLRRIARRAARCLLDEEPRPSPSLPPDVPFDNRDEWMHASYLRLNQDPLCSKRPQYIWGVLEGAALGKVLGLERISVIEFGVARGAGLIAMERAAELAEERVGIGIDVYGFDTGVGLPKITDYRDVPFRWSEGFWPMDKQELQKRLRRAKLVLGVTKETVPAFIQANPAPVAFAGFDMTLYSSTADALALYGADHNLLLPRTFCMFRSLMGSRGDQCDFIGERLAIHEFNTKYAMRKLSPMYGLRHFVPPVNNWLWPDIFYCLHIFDHPLYNRPSSLRQSVDIDVDGTEHIKEVPREK
jgi:hypothetical protein